MRSLLMASEALRIAVGAILANKVRGLLTALGIIIGIVAVTTTMTAFNGMRAAFQQGIASVGADVIYVSRTPWIIMGDWFVYQKRPTVTLDQAAELKDAFRGRAIVSPSMGTGRDLKFRSEVMSGANVIGVTELMPLISGRLPESGRFITRFEVDYARNSVVIGSSIAEGMFKGTDPINKEINIGRNKYRVVGVLEKQGGNTFGGPDLDRQVIIPISAFTKHFGGRRDSNVDIAVKSPSLEVMSDLEYEVIGAMRKIRGLRPGEDDDFSINKLDSLMGAFNNVVGAVLGIGLLVTSISLFVGGIGVMNIMFVSVTERTREIGIRKAIGARRGSILLQFLLEAAIICLMGGLVGVALATLVTVGINASGLMPASISPGILVGALIISVLVGVVSGFVPAWKGARLDPIEALRYE